MDIHKFYQKDISTLMEVDNEESSQTMKSYDALLIKTMLRLRFKLMNFMNTAHDLMCNQVANFFCFSIILSFVSIHSFY